MRVRISQICKKNNRNDIDKPMEDYCLIDENNGIFILADGTTRPHNEYSNSQITKHSLAYAFAKEIVEYMHAYLIKTLNHGCSLPEAITETYSSANAYWRKTHANQANMSYPPTAAFLVAVISNGMLYYSNTCDTIGILLRNRIKITLTEQHNRRVKKEGTFDKAYIYRNIYNCVENEYGYGMLNGNENFDRFISVGQIELLPNDRVFLSTDGMLEYLITTPGRILTKTTKVEEMILQSSAFDIPPYANYADDKCLVVIDVVE